MSDESPICHVHSISSRGWAPVTAQRGSEAVLSLWTCWMHIRLSTAGLKWVTHLQCVPSCPLAVGWECLGCKWGGGRGGDERGLFLSRVPRNLVALTSWVTSWVGWFPGQQTPSWQCGMLQFIAFKCPSEWGPVRRVSGWCAVCCVVCVSILLLPQVRLTRWWTPCRC